jgi:uncharacterized protein (DUF2141 family)
MKGDAGKCRVALYMGPTNFNNPEYAIAKGSIDIVDSKTIWQIEIDPARFEPVGGSPTVAVSAFHDLNDNQKLDKNSLGIPIERYGFSNNPKRGFGPPKYAEASVPIDATAGAKSLSITIEIQ